MSIVKAHIGKESTHRSSHVSRQLGDGFTSTVSHVDDISIQIVEYDSLRRRRSKSTE